MQHLYFSPVICKVDSLIERRLPKKIVHRYLIQTLLFVFFTANMPFAHALEEKIVNPDADECVKISRIYINPNNIYDDTGSINTLKSALNFLHFTTRSSAIKDELLFKTGDCFHTDLLKETERNLRASDIFSYAYVTSVLKGNTRQITVTTTDRFTLRLEASAGLTGNSTKTRISFGEKNFLGLNKKLNYSNINETNKKKRTRIVFSSPRNFHDYALNALYIGVDNNALQRYTFSKPFYSLSDKNQYFISYFKDDTDTTFVVPNQENIDIPQLSEREVMGYQWELGSAKHSRRIGTSLSNTETTYFPNTASRAVPSSVFIPAPTKVVDFTTSFAWRNRKDFLILRGVDSLISDEDIELQQSASMGLGLQLRDDNGQSHLHNTLLLGWGGAHYDQRFLSSYRINSSSRYFAGGLREVNVNAFFHGYYFHSASQSYVSSVAYRYRYSRDELNFPLSIGADVGLRGHEIDSITGNKSLIINLEHRYQYPVDSRLFALGQGIFVDAGYAWQRNEDIKLSDLEVDVGWGLRLNAPSLFGNKIARFDIAFSTATHKSVVTLKIGQIFNYNKFSNNQSKE